MRRTLAVVGAVVASLSTAPAASASQTVSHPEDGFATIQEAVDAAGCGGRVLLAEGTYNGRVFAGCGVHLIGAGVGRTILRDEGLEPLQGGLVNFGGVPFAPSEFTRDYEIAHMTIESGADHASLVGISAAWTRGVHVHDVEVVGFTVGVGIAVSTDGTIDRVHVRGPELAEGPLTKCVSFTEFGLFLDELAHMTGHRVYRSLLEDCAIGVDLQNMSDGVVAFNMTRAPLLGVNVFGASNLSIHHNILSHSNFVGGPFVAAGIDPSNMSNSAIHHNVFCDDTIGIHLSFNQSPDAFGFPASSHNLIHHNVFGQVGDDVVLSAPDTGPGNKVFKNVNRPSLACP